MSPFSSIQLGTAGPKLNSQFPKSDFCGCAYTSLVGHRVFLCAVLGTQRFNAFDKSFLSNLEIIISKKQTYFKTEWLLDAEFKG